MHIELQDLLKTGLTDTLRNEIFNVTHIILPLSEIVVYNFSKVKINHIGNSLHSFASIIVRVSGW